MWPLLPWRASLAQLWTVLLQLILFQCRFPEGFYCGVISIPIWILHLLVHFYFHQYHYARKRVFVPTEISQFSETFNCFFPSRQYCPYPRTCHRETCPLPSVGHCFLCPAPSAWQVQGRDLLSGMTIKLLRQLRISNYDRIENRLPCLSVNLPQLASGKTWKAKSG